MESKSLIYLSAILLAVISCANSWSYDEAFADSYGNPSESSAMSGPYNDRRASSGSSEQVEHNIRVKRQGVKGRPQPPPSYDTQQEEDGFQPPPRSNVGAPQRTRPSAPRPSAPRPRPQEDEGQVNAAEGEADAEPPIYGGVMGTPGVDFPGYTQIPKTSFSCSDQQYEPGMYADMETQCQAYHYCFQGRKESFLCGVGTVFNQAILGCDYWHGVDCSTTPQFYSVNEELGKAGAEPGPGGPAPASRPLPAAPRPAPVPGGPSPIAPSGPRPGPAPRPAPRPIPGPRPSGPTQETDEEEGDYDTPQIPQPAPRPRPQPVSRPQPAPRPQPVQRPQQPPSTKVAAQIPRRPQPSPQQPAPYRPQQPAPGRKLPQPVQRPAPQPRPAPQQRPVPQPRPAPAPRPAPIPAPRPDSKTQAPQRRPIAPPQQQPIAPRPVQPRPAPRPISKTSPPRQRPAPVIPKPRPAPAPIPQKPIVQTKDEEPESEQQYDY